MFQLSIEESQKLYEIRKKIDALYEEQEILVSAAMSKYKDSVEGVFTVSADEKPFKRVRILDGIEELKAGKTIYKTSTFSRFTLEISELKNEPKSEAKPMISEKSSPKKSRRV